MKKLKLYLVVSVLFSMNAFCREQSDCGEYLIRGRLVKDNSSLYHFKYIILEKTKNETVFHFSKIEELSKVIPYLEQFTELKINISTAMDGTKGVIATVNSVNITIPNPLKMGQDFEQIKKRDCMKN